MKIENADIDIDLLEFRDRLNIIRSTAGCSFKGKVEFDARLNLAQEIINKNQESTIADLYQDDVEFRHHCDRCLILNGIEPDWLTDRHLVALLFLHKNSIGALVKLNAVNNPKPVKEQKAGKKDNLYHQFLGGLYSFTQDPEQAFRLAEERPFKEVMGMVNSASANQEKPTPSSAPKPPSQSPKKREMSDRDFTRLMAAKEQVRKRT